MSTKVLLSQIILSATYGIDVDDKQIKITPSKLTGIPKLFHNRELFINDRFVQKIPDNTTEVSLEDFEFFAGDKIEIFGEN